ncbi:hypothetical protein BDN70DRAFT_640829 [Pholiota conissans]|uniref:Uncharacterized protein n=1 Tax=Pholiota conissans TaxID=109636 RepID=A0A9P5Z2E0_9AGAR|nr:hypothetical protein BDN70DRAFT_640829 [Pholiota conissans]
MLFLLALVAALHGSIHAAPTIISAVPRDPFSSSDTSTTPGCVCPNTRSVWDIIWSCAATVFACSWVSVHPNIPAPGKKEWEVLLMRLELMVWTIIAPEMMILWAIRQWLGARKLSARYKDHAHWTMTHGYFLQMGGFMVHDGSRPRGILSPERMEALLQARLIEFPAIAEEEINDRSKGDALSKGLVLGQTTWFIAQCITRRAEGLIMTELELVTLAFASLNFCMHFFWWNKPLDVRTRVLIYAYDTPIPEKAYVLPKLSISVFRDPTTTPENKPAKSARFYSDVMVGFMLDIFIRWPWRSIKFACTRLGDMAEFAGRSNIVEDTQECVHSFYAMNTSDTESNWIVGIVSVIGIIFGGIHCMGWSFLFPTRVEAVVWQVASVIVTTVPVLMAVSVVSQSMCTPQTFCLEVFFEDPKEVLATVAIYFGSPLYIIARLVLLIEALVALRYLPGEALLEVRWAPFLPLV